MKKILMVTAVVMMLTANLGCGRQWLSWLCRPTTCDVCGSHELPAEFDGEILLPPDSAPGILPGSEAEVLPLP